MIPPDVLAALDGRAALEDVSRSEALARIVREWQAGARGAVADEHQAPAGEPQPVPVEEVTPETLSAALDP